MRWYVLKHNSTCLKPLLSEMARLGVEAYSPTRTTLRNRTDRPSPAKSERPLFPGYLFVRFDYEEIHPTKISALNGAHKFVRFVGGSIGAIQDWVIENLKNRLILRPDRTLNFVEYKDLPTQEQKALHLIMDMQSEAARRMALLALLQTQAMREQIESRRYALISSVLDD